MKITTKDLIEFDSLSQDELKKQAKIFLHCIPERAEQTITYIHTEFKDKEILYLCIRFINHIFLDGFKSYLDIIQKIGFFPSNETQKSLQEAINHALIGSYRSSYDHLKRAIEMMCVTIYFSDSSIDSTHAKSWFSSNIETPFFKRTINHICKFDRFINFDKKFSWKEKMKKLYYQDICDITHIRGFEKSYLNLGLSQACISGIDVPSVSKITLNGFLNTYINVVQEICTMLALYNPVLLIDIPIDQKFGLNGPISGFFQSSQPDILKKIIPLTYRNFFNQLILKDNEVISVKNWFDSQPDITDEELEQQSRQLGYHEFDKDNNSN